MVERLDVEALWCWVNAGGEAVEEEGEVVREDLEDFDFLNSPIVRIPFSLYI